jgi:ankyrin repeat protein
VQILKKLFFVVGGGDFINRPDRRGMLPLHYAVLMGSFYIVQEFIQFNLKKAGEQKVEELVNSP